MQPVAIVTGAAGFLGSHIASLLANWGYRVIGVGRAPGQAGLSEVLQQNKASLLVHAAGPASIEASVRDPYADYQGSVELTASVLEAVRKHCPDTHFVLISSASVYGAPSSLPISESHEVSPISPYGFHKRMAELLVEQAVKLYNLRATILRVFSAYGEGIRRQVIFDLCSKLVAANGKPVVLRGTGNETRDFVHARDVAACVQHVAKTRSFGVYNVAGGRQMSIADLAALVSRHFGAAGAITFDGVCPPGVPQYWQADISKLLATGARIEVPLERGVEEFCSWFKHTHAPASETKIVSMPDKQGPSTVERRLSVGFTSMGTWMGGIAYLDILTKALSRLPDGKRPRMSLLFNDLSGFEQHARIIARMDEVIFVGPQFDDVRIPGDGQLAVRKVARLEDALENLDALYPINSDMFPSEKAISWIPDFQHLYLPQLFSREARVDRDRRYKLIAEQASHVVFSSHDAANNFQRYAAHPKAQTHVLPFYSLPEDEWYAADPAAVQAKYGLPGKFLICCNQFWEHKNHLTLFSAIKILRENGIHVPLVCTGDLTDSRNPEYLAKVQSSLRDFGIEDLVYVLGSLPREDQLQLMRASIAVVQPSLFEGWSTVVEDARAFGKTIFLSSLNVHREQAPRFGIYFDPHNAVDLAEKFVQESAHLRAGPDRQREQVARIDADAFGTAYAEKFLAMVEQVGGVAEPELRPRAEKGEIDLSIVVATKNRDKLLADMLASIPHAVRGLSYEIIVVDGGSAAETMQLLQSTPFVTVYDEAKELGPGRHSWPLLYNFGFERARGKWAIYASDDITFEENCFSSALAALEAAPPTTAGGIFFYKNEVAEEGWQHLGIDFLARSLPLLNYGVVKHEVFVSLGGLDPEYKFYAADGDLTYKIANAGLLLLPLPGCNVTHHNLLDTQKKVNLQAVSSDMGTLKQRWHSLGEGEAVSPRRMLWDPALREVFSIGFSKQLPLQQICKVWEIVAKTQHGQHSSAIQRIQDLLKYELPIGIYQSLAAYLQSQVTRSGEVSSRR